MRISVVQDSRIGAHGAVRRVVVLSWLPAALPVVLLWLLAAMPLRSQQSWLEVNYAASVVGEPITDSAMPALVIMPNGLTYATYYPETANPLFQNRLWHLRSSGAFPGGHSTGVSVPRSAPLGPAIVRHTNALVIDSNLRQHIFFAIGSPLPCLQYAAFVHSNDTVAPPFPQALPDAPCSSTLQHVSAAADGDSRLYITYDHDGQIHYRHRSDDSLWSPAIVPSAPSSHNRLPRIAVTPAGGVHIVYLASTSPDDSLAGLHYAFGTGISLSAPRSLAVLPASAPAAITIDSSGACHLAFVINNAPQRNAVVYMKLIDGAVVSTDTLAAGMPIVISAISLASDRYGALHLVANYTPAGSPDGERDLLYIGNASGSWSEPQAFTRSGVDDHAYDAGSGFLSIRDSMMGVVYVSELDDGSGRRNITLAGAILDFRPRLHLPPDTIEIGEIPPGSFNIIVPVHNRGSRLYETLRLRGMDILNDSGIHLQFDAPPIPRFDPVRGGDSVDFTLPLETVDTGRFHSRLIVRTNGGNDTVVLLGRIAAPPAVPHTIRLDSASTAVGSQARLHATITPPLQPDDAVRQIRLQVRFSPRALFPATVAAPATPASPQVHYTYDGAGSVDIMINAVGGGYITGGDLFTIGLEGLLTADHLNVVQLDASPVVELPVILTAPGLVRVEGCEVGGDLGFARAGFTGPILPNPAGGHVRFSYAAPPGIEASVRILDPAGRRCLALTLPAAGDDVRTAELDVRGLAPGAYLLELRVGDRSYTAMFIKL